RTAVQHVLLPRLPVEHVFDPVEDEPAVGDPVGEASWNRPEMRRMGYVILDDGAPGQDFGARSRLGGDEDLVHLSAVDCAECMCAHFALPLSQWSRDR